MAAAGKSRFKKLIGQVHLWLGLTSGIIVVLVSLTGCLFVFQKEISGIVFSKTFNVEPQQTRLPLSVLQQNAQKAMGANKPINSVTTYKDPSKAWEFMAYKANDTAITYFGVMEHYESVFVNPHTGEITGKRNYKYDFFFIVKYLHWSLLLNTKYGQPVVGYATLIFVIMMITGLILWWPKKWNKANRKKSFRIKWDAKFKRINYDLHNVLGFYAMLIAMVIAFTGMVWAFQWFEKLVYVTAAGTSQKPESKVVKSDSLLVATSNPLDIAYAEAVKQFSDCKRIGISPAYGKEGTIYMFGYRGKETYYDYDQLQFDQYSGKLLLRTNHQEHNRGERLIGMNYDIHVGAIGGLPGKILAFVISLICASLPITGFYIWWGRRHNKPSYKKQAVAAMTNA
ncbi:MAG: PepSY-associated TM helix domain-containing protein [Chitinophagaceae bacterium]